MLIHKPENGHFQVRCDKCGAVSFEQRTIGAALKSLDRMDGELHIRAQAITTVAKNGTVNLQHLCGLCAPKDPQIKAKVEA